MIKSFAHLQLLSTIKPTPATPVPKDALLAITLSTVPSVSKAIFSLAHALDVREYASNVILVGKQSEDALHRMAV